MISIEKLPMKSKSVNTPLISVIVPCYNKKEYLAQCLDSILAQKTNFPYKITVIDDCSTDGSYQIAQKYSKKHPHLTLLRNKKNFGLLSTIIACYERIDTQFYTVLDADDYWLTTDKLQKAVDFLSTHPNHTIYVNNTFIDNDNRRRKQLPYNKEFDYTYSNDNNHIIIGHTSGTVFRNCWSKKYLSKLKKELQGGNEQAFRGDLFRLLYNLNFGIAHYDPEVKSVYRYNQLGIWSSTDENEQRLANARAFLAIFEFLNYQNPSFFITTSWWLLGQIFIKKPEFIEQNAVENHALHANNLQKNKFEDCLNRIANYIQASNFFEACNIPKTVCFFLPSKSVGDYQFLFMRLAKYFSKILKLNVFYVDEVDGYVSSQLQKTAVKIIKYTGQKTITLPDNTTVITAVTWAYQMPKFIGKDIKLFFWIAHLKSLLSLQRRIKVPFARVKSFSKLLGIKDGYCLVDLSNYLAVKKQLGSAFNLKERYTPIFTYPKQTITNYSLVDAKEINCAWLGKLDSDRIYSLINLLEGLYQYKTALKKRVHVVGTGDSYHLVDENRYSDRIEIVKLGVMTDRKLDNYLTKNVDVMFAMGTSMLEAAALGIPTVNLVSSDGDGLSDKCVWLSDCRKYTLGAYEDLIQQVTNNIFSIKDVLDEIYCYKNKAMRGKESLQHLLNNHTIKNTANRLLLLLSTNGLFQDSYLENFTKITAAGILRKFKKLLNKIRSTIGLPELIRQR